jgi:hypothetical protein
MAWLEQNRMVDNARELAERLSPLAERGLNLSLHVFDDESHVSAPPLAIGKGLRIGLRPRVEAEASRRLRHA